MRVESSSGNGTSQGRRKSSGRSRSGGSRSGEKRRSRRRRHRTPPGHSRYDAVFPEEQKVRDVDGSDWDFTSSSDAMHDDWDENNDSALRDRLGQLGLYRSEESARMRTTISILQEKTAAGCVADVIGTSTANISISPSASYGCVRFDEGIGIGSCTSSRQATYVSDTGTTPQDATTGSGSTQTGGIGGTIPTLATFIRPHQRRASQPDTSMPVSSLSQSFADEIAQVSGCSPSIAPEDDEILQSPSHPNDKTTRKGGKQRDASSSSPVSVGAERSMNISQVSNTPEVSDGEDEDDQSTDTELWELQQELSALKRLASTSTCSTPTCSPDRASTYALSRKTVRFSHPLVTTVKHRPRTTQDELRDLFWGVDELLELENDRESRVFDERVELVMSGGIDEGMRVSVSYPKPIARMSAAAFRRKDSGVCVR